MIKKIIIMFLMITTFVLAKDINVGDRVGLRISGVNEETITNAFKNSNIEIDSIKNIGNDTYEVYIRSYKVGSQTINLGNQKLVIDTKSVLTPQDKNIKENLSDNSNKKLYNIDFPAMAVGSGIIFILAAFYLFSIIKTRDKLSPPVDPDKRYNDKINNLSNENWPYDLSSAIREYIDSQKNTHFTNGFYDKIHPLNDDDISFLHKLDDYKFSKNDDDLKDKYLRKANEIYKKVGEKDV